MVLKIGQEISWFWSNGLAGTLDENPKVAACIRSGKSRPAATRPISFKVQSSIALWRRYCRKQSVWKKYTATSQSIRARAEQLCSSLSAHRNVWVIRKISIVYVEMKFWVRWNDLLLRYDVIMSSLWPWDEIPIWFCKFFTTYCSHFLILCLLGC